MGKRAFQVFSGFPEGRLRTVNLPDAVFTDLLPLIDNVDEAKVTLLLLYKLAQKHSDAAPWVTLSELQTDALIKSAFVGDDPGRLQAALEHAVRRGAILGIEYRSAEGNLETRYFANSPRGRAAVSALQRGETLSMGDAAYEQPNIFALYEQNIGPLTPMLSEELLDAEKDYPAEWIEAAIREAVELNKRSWRYIRAILENWRTEGRDEIDRRDRQPDGKKYIQGKYGSLIEH